MKTTTNHEAEALWARHGANMPHTDFLIWPSSLHEVGIVIPILQMSKLRLREPKYIGQDYSATKQLGQDLNSGGSVPEPEPLVHHAGYITHTFTYANKNKLPFTKHSPCP